MFSVLTELNSINCEHSLMLFRRMIDVEHAYSASAEALLLWKKKANKPENGAKNVEKFCSLGSSLREIDVW